MLSLPIQSINSNEVILIFNNHLKEREWNYYKFFLIFTISANMNPRDLFGGPNTHCAKEKYCYKALWEGNLGEK